jgi:tripartite-type tricarboxylate transporter receptor subunit TctC
VKLVCQLLCVSLMALAYAAANGQQYPTKPIRLIVPFAAGSTLDIMGRAIGPELTKALGQPMIVDNRPGANGSISLDVTAKAPKDGYTLTITSAGPLAINPGLDPRLPWDPIKDFTPITQVARGPLILVTNAAVPAKNLKELIALARSRPGKLTYGSSGIGGSNHLAGELLCISAGIKLVHVPYKGNAESITDLLGGHIDMVITGIPPVLAHLQSGKLRAIVNTGPARSPVLPDLPTVAESGLPAAQVNVWYGLVAPAGTPHDIIDRLSDVVGKIMKGPEISERFASLGTEAVSNSPEQFARMVREDVAKWAKLIKQQGIKLE